MAVRKKFSFAVIQSEIDDLLKRILTGPDRERDRTIFWLYFRQGMSTKEIASLPTLGLTAKGVASVLERVKRCIREQIVGPNSLTQHKEREIKSKLSSEFVIGMYRASDYGTSA